MDIYQLIIALTAGLAFIFSFVTFFLNIYYRSKEKFLNIYIEFKKNDENQKIFRDIERNLVDLPDIENKPDLESALDIYLSYLDILCMLLNENIILKKKYFCLLKDDIEKMNNNKKIKDYLYKINHHSYVLINKEYHYYQNLITLWRKETIKKNDYNNRLHFKDWSIKGLHDLNIENLTTCYLITDEPTRDQSNFETLNNRNILSEEENIQIIQILLDSIEDNEIKKTVGRLMGNKNYTLIIKTLIKYINNH